MNCLGQPNLAAVCPPSISGPHAMRGTGAHAVLELCFDADAEALDYEGEEMGNGTIMTLEDVEAVQEAIDFLKKELEDGEYTIMKEVKFHLDRLHKDLFGTGDIVLVSEDLTKLKVFDYKHGAGTKVEVHENSQLLYYGLGAIDEISKRHNIPYVDTMGWGHVFDEVTIGIIQPRCFHSAGPLRKWKVPPERLDSFAKELKEAAHATEKKNAPLKAGDWCKWCPAIAKCPEFRTGVMKTIDRDFDKIEALDPPDPSILSTEQIIKVLQFQDSISDWLKQVNAFAYRTLEKGGVVPGYKLVRKRANRKWADEDLAPDGLLHFMSAEDMCDLKFRSPAKIEKILKDQYGIDKKDIAHLIIKPEAGLTLAPEHDKREAVILDPASEFEVIE